jgi:RNA polymerase sigma-70 factor (family 1)
MASIIAHNNSLYIDDFRSGKEEGFNYFFNACYKPLYFFASRYVKDVHAAEDIITESFIKLWDKREIFETEAGVKGYLYKSVYNACLRWLEQEQRKTIHTKSYAKQINTTEQPYLNDIIKAETINNLHKAITHLPSQCRTVFTKLFIEGKSVSETAQEMNLTISTIKNQKARGIKLLKPLLSPAGGACPGLSGGTTST